MTVLRVVPAPAGPRRDRSLRDLLAECGFVAEPGPVLVCEETYCDTLDGRLFAAGYRLFHRAGDERWYLERRGARLATQPGRLGREPGDGPVLAGLENVRGKHRLLPQLVVRREERRLTTPHSPGAELELRWQEFSFRDPYGPGRAEGPRVLVLDGDLAGPVERETADILLRRLDGLAQDHFDPYAEGLAMLGLPLPGRPVPARDRVRPGDTPHAATAKILRRQSQVLRARRRGADLDLDVEFVHQIRVATRRTRATLKLLAPELDGAAVREIRDELAWLGRALGPARDMDVLLPLLDRDLDRVRAPETAAEQVRDAFRRRRRHALDEARVALRSERYDALLERLERNPPGPARPAEVSAPGGPSLADIGVRRVRRAQRRVVKRGRSAVRHGTPEAELHRVRIEFKKLRYAADLFSPFLDGNFGKRVRRIARFQDCLGELNDAHTLRENLRDLAAALAARGPDADLLLTLGALVQVQNQRIEDRRMRFAGLWKSFPGEARRIRDHLATLGDAP